MPFMKTRSADIYADEILFRVAGDEMAENAVVDATAIDAETSGRRVLRAGTVMAFSITTDRTSKVVPADVDTLAIDIAGIVMHTTEFASGTMEAGKDDAPIALFTKNCHFRASKLVGYTIVTAAKMKTAMGGAGNDRCANCTFIG